MAEHEGQQETCGLGLGQSCRQAARRARQAEGERTISKDGEEVLSVWRGRCHGLLTRSSCHLREEEDGGWGQCPLWLAEVALGHLGETGQQEGSDAL